jgi:class 3 adenylate cyclase
LRLYVRNQLLEQTVTSYVGRKLARKYMREQRRDFLKPGARKQELTIFFSDIAGFTTISEGMDSSDLAH